jgi:hypothetical protein
MNKNKPQANQSPFFPSKESGKQANINPRPPSEAKPNPPPMPPAKKS